MSFVTYTVGSKTYTTTHFSPIAALSHRRLHPVDRTHIYLFIHTNLSVHLSSHNYSIDQQKY